MPPVGFDRSAAKSNEAACTYKNHHHRNWPNHSGKKEKIMSIGTILIILLVIFLLGGFSGRFGGYGYGFGHGGVSVLGVILIVIVVLVLTGRL